MAKRMLDCYASDFAGFSKEELLESVRRSEGRVMLCETIGTVRPMLGDVTNAEFAAAMGADFLLLNMFDVNEPKIEGLPAGPWALIWNPRIRGRMRRPIRCGRCPPDGAPLW